MIEIDVLDGLGSGAMVDYIVLALVGVGGVQHCGQKTREGALGLPTISDPDRADPWGAWD